jgi:hypothetical protein
MPKKRLEKANKLEKADKTEIDKKEKKRYTWWQWLIFILVLFVIILIIIILIYRPVITIEREVPCASHGLKCYTGSCPTGYGAVDLSCNKNGKVCCEKIQEKSQCEKYGNICYNGSCPNQYIGVGLSCNNNMACCRNISIEETPCKEDGDICLKTSPSEPGCPSNYYKVELGCMFGEICCKKTITPCESYNYFCMDSCGENYLELDLGCNSGESCCKYKIDSREECEDAGYSCHYSSCNSGYISAGICDKDDPCCKKDTSTNKTFIYGIVKLKQGNCTLPINPNLCKLDALTTDVAIFPKVSALDMQGTYYETNVEPIKEMQSIKNGIIGYYEMDLLPGEYSIFAQDPLYHKNFYCNSFDFNGCACCFVVTNVSQQKDITIDHSTY